MDVIKFKDNLNLCSMTNWNIFVPSVASKVTDPPPQLESIINGIPKNNEFLKGISRDACKFLRLSQTLEFLRLS